MYICGYICAVRLVVILDLWPRTALNPYSRVYSTIHPFVPGGYSHHHLYVDTYTSILARVHLALCGTHKATRDTVKVEGPRLTWVISREPGYIRSSKWMVSLWERAQKLTARNEKKYLFKIVPFQRFKLFSALMKLHYNRCRYIIQWILNMSLPQSVSHSIIQKLLRFVHFELGDWLSYFLYLKAYSVIHFVQLNSLLILNILRKKRLNPWDIRIKLIKKELIQWIESKYLRNKHSFQLPNSAVEKLRWKDWLGWLITCVPRWSKYEFNYGNAIPRVIENRQ